MIITHKCLLEQCGSRFRYKVLRYKQINKLFTLTTDLGLNGEM